jgi:uncharacterized protein YjbJ (UPF0337 family)
MVDMDDIKNEADRLAGKTKEKVGDVTENRSLQAEGIAQEAGAAARQAAKDVKDAVTDDK